jgi:hypothetical protein
MSEKWRPAFKSALAIKISFYSFSGLVNSESDRGSLGLCTRVLYRFFSAFFFVSQVLLFSFEFTLFDISFLVSQLFSKHTPKSHELSPLFFLHCSSMVQSDLNLGYCIEFIANHFVSALPSDVSSSVTSASSTPKTSVSAACTKPLLVLLLVDELSKPECEDKIL